MFRLSIPMDSSYITNRLISSTMVMRSGIGVILVVFGLILSLASSFKPSRHAIRPLTATQNPLHFTRGGFAITGGQCILSLHASALCMSTLQGGNPENPMVSEVHRLGRNCAPSLSDIITSGGKLVSSSVLGSL